MQPTPGSAKGLAFPGATREAAQVRLSPTAMLWCCALSCTPKPTPCQAPQDCDEGHECLALRCLPQYSDPVLADSVRNVLAPSRFGVSGVDGDSPPSVQLREDGRVALYIEFPPPRLPPSTTKPGKPQQLSDAFLLLPRPQNHAADPDTTTLLVRHVREPWSAASVARGRRPDDSAPQAAGLARHHRTVRIDVTRIVQHQLERPSEAHGLRVSVEQGSTTLSTGLGGGDLPQLELYWVHE